MKGSSSKMAVLFLYAAVVQGAIAALITFLGAFGDQIGLWPVAASRVIAGGEAGTWFTVGYVVYLIVGVVAMAVTSLFYFFIESVQGKQYKGVAKGLAWVHLVFGNIGVAGAALLTMVGGYLGGAAMQPAKFGGQGWSTGLPVQITTKLPVVKPQFGIAGKAGFHGQALDEDVGHVQRGAVCR
jgi:vacuolar-type H+-ATPase subunit I/STV1